jgi:hypothetical protein
MALVEAADRGGISGTLRVYAAIPLAPAWVGAALALMLITVFLGSELALGRYELLRAADDPMAALRDLRLAIIHCLLIAYVPTAYVYVIRRARRTVFDLRPTLDCSESDLREVSEAVGSYRWWGLMLVGLMMIAFWIHMTNETTPPQFSPWAWGRLAPEVRWQRVLGPILVWWVGCFFYAVIAESYRLSRLADRLASIDLLDVRPLMPFTRQALSNALLILVGASISSLFLLEGGFMGLITSVWTASVVTASASFVQPVRGVRRRIRAEKQAELEWCRGELRRARVALKEGASDPDRARMDEIAAYKQLVEGVREWPFDTSTLARFALYLVIPLASWSGGALVERMIDALLE